MQMQIIYIGVLIFIALAGCSNKPKPNGNYDQYQKYMNTETVFHDITLDSSARSSQSKEAKKDKDSDFIIEHPFYLVSIEKVNHKQAGEIKFGNCSGKNYCLNTDSNYFSTGTDDKEVEYKKQVKKDIEKRLTPSKWALSGGKSMIISHVTNYFENSSTQNWDYCFLYNIYNTGKLCSQNTSQYTDINQSYYDHSWDVIDSLKIEIEDRINEIQPTHIILYSTGWNTPQWESIKNYRDLANSLIKASKEDASPNFKPLFIGISWPSYVSTNFLGGNVDLTVKAGDADEIGLIYGNLILNKIMLPMQKKHGVRTVLIGHSLGGRIVSTTVNASPLLQSANNNVFEKADIVIGLQAAYSVNRIVDKVGEKASIYRDFPLFSKHIFMTSSQYDTANKIFANPFIPFSNSFIPYIGSQVSADLTRKDLDYDGEFSYLSINHNGIPYYPYKTSSMDCGNKVTIADASNIVNQIVPKH